MEFHKKGQGLSLNVIIIAALALIVLVVLAVIFTTRTLQFDVKINQETKKKLIKLKITYGSCQPTEIDENSFVTQYDTAADDITARVQAKSTFEQRIQTCKAVTDKGACEAGSCKWKG